LTGSAADAQAPVAPGLFRFGLDGRSAPGLFVAGWLAVVVGCGLAAVGLFALNETAASLLFVAGAAGLLVGLLLLGGSQVAERRAAGAAGWSGPSPVLVAVASLPATYLGVVAVGTPLALAGSDPPRAVVELLLIGVQAAVTIGLVRILVVGAAGLSWRELGLHGSPGPALREAAWGALLAGPTILVTAIVVAAVGGLVGAAPESPLPPVGTLDGLLLHLAAGAILAPFAEEILFRGVAVTAWARTAGPRAAIVRSAVLFAVAHVLTVGGDDFGFAARLALVGFVGRLPVALVLAWVYLRRGSLWSAVGLHATFNAVLITVAESAAG